MDFFTAQARSKRTTKLLIALFALATLAVVGSVTAITALVLMLYRRNAAVYSGDLRPALDDWPLLAAVAVATLLLIALASLYRIARLAQGGGAVARQLGATEVSTDTKDRLRRRLVNVVEEMAIASGVPAPEVFVLEREGGINAFAAGFSPSDAAVAVTRGALEQLDRSELQGVIGHEFSHILNGDMRLNMRLIGVLYGILVLSLVGRSVLRAGRYARVGGSSRNGGGVAVAIILGLALAIIGAVGVFFGRLIKAAVSRQREFLADASAVQFTRDPSGLAGALKKIGGFSGNFTAADSEEVAHMLFARGARAFRGLFATHPPLEERIRLLDASFEVPDSVPSPAIPSGDDRVSALAAAQAADRAGAVGAQELAFAAELRNGLPEELLANAHSMEGSVLLIFALVLDRDQQHREQQLGFLKRKLGEARARHCQRLAQTLDEAGPAARLPLLEIAFPRLKDRPEQQLEFVLDLSGELAALDDELKVFEFVVVRLLESYLRDGGNIQSGRGKLADAELGEALKVLLTTVAAYGHEQDAAAVEAAKRGLSAINFSPGSTELKPRRRLERLDAALAQLNKLKLAERRRVLIALHACIGHDGKLTLTESELFRAVAAVLGCPLPPLVLDPRYVK